MQTDFNRDIMHRASYLVGEDSLVETLPNTSSLPLFDDEVVSFLNDLSHTIMKSAVAKRYSDLITFAFWIRKASVLKLKERFYKDDVTFRLGKGIVFHIAPTNVPVNFAYSFTAGLLCGNANIVRVPAKKFEQVRILAELINTVLNRHPDMKPYIIFIRYGHDKEINDLFSSMADVRIIWGGDQTIEEIRQSPLSPRAGEITFADRYSIAVIDSDAYLALEDKEKIAEGFYNDTFFSDQNACTSPRLVVWIGEHKEEAKSIFWEKEHEIAKDKYIFQDIQSINKLSKACLAAVQKPGIQVLPRSDNLIVRVAVPDMGGVIDLRENSGFFYEYNCDDLMELEDLCRDKRIQTIAYIGDKEDFLPLLKSGIKGVDRIVPIGKTMDFDLIWDGYDLPAMLTRAVIIE